MKPERLPQAPQSLPEPNDPRNPEQIKTWVSHKNAHIKPSRVQPWFLGGETFFSAQQVRLHNKHDDAWIVDSEQSVYDITPLLMWFDHPGIELSRNHLSQDMRQPAEHTTTVIENKLSQMIGNPSNVSNDKQFHTKQQKKLWDAMRIGRLENSLH